MMSEIKGLETSEMKNKEVKPHDTDGLKDVKPQNGMTTDQAKNYWKNQFEAALNSKGPETGLDNSAAQPDTKEISSAQNSEVGNAQESTKNDCNDGYYVSYEERLKHTPVDSERGSWTGKRGESKYIPSEDTDEGRKAKQELDKRGLDGIEYENGEPNFSKCAEAIVKIDNMTVNRSDYVDDNGNYCPGNFSQADAKCAEQWSASAKDGKTDWTAKDVRTWRQENNFSWHECCDTKTMELVPRPIHEFFTHSGGVAECKARNASNNGGVFDE